MISAQRALYDVNSHLELQAPALDTLLYAAGYVRLHSDHVFPAAATKAMSGLSLIISSTQESPNGDQKLIETTSTHNFAASSTQRSASVRVKKSLFALASISTNSTLVIPNASKN